MNILFVTRKFPPSVGGMENYAADLYKAISAQEKVTLVKWGGSNKWLPLVLPLLTVQGMWVLLTKKVDVIHMQDGVLAPIGWLLSRLFRKPFVVVAHGLDLTYKLQLYQAINISFLRKADYVFCISGAAQSEAVKRGVDIKKTKIIPLGITDDLFTNDKNKARDYVAQKLNVASNTKIILSVGRLVRRKGVRWFVENVMPKLAEKNNNIVFAISGDGEEKEAIEQAIKKHTLEGSVFLLGRTSDEYMQNLYNAADVFVMPNIVVPNDMEGFGRVLLEAALCEMPVVAAGIEGIKDAVTNGKNGVLVKSEDTEAFVENINRFVNDPNAAKKFGQQARTYTLEHYNWTAIGEQFLQTYQRIIKRP